MSQTGKAVFLSYAHEDAEAVRGICDALRAVGIEVWFDQSELRGGDIWDQKLRRQIRECALFLPVISAHTEARREGYFRREWKLAVHRLDDIADNVPFLVPVVIDETTERGAMVPEAFGKVQWTRLPRGAPMAAFGQRVQSLLGLTAPASRPAAASESTPVPPTRPRWSVLLWSSAVLATLVIGVGAYFAIRTPAKNTSTPVATAKTADETKRAASGPRYGAKSIAVLPFANRSTEKENEFFTDGMHDDILTHLSRIRELHVTSRTSVEQYRGTTKTVPQIGEELGVAFVLEGSVQRSGNKVRVTGQLIRAATDEHGWAKSYDKDLTASDIFALQSELAQAIAGELKATISPQEKKLIENRPTENLIAYDLYLKARTLREAGQRGGQNERIALLQAAVQLDPNFAIAWALLGQNLANASNLSDTLSGPQAANAKIAIEHAVRLAPDSSETLQAQARYLMWIEKDYLQAIRVIKRVLRQSPNYSDAHAVLGHIARYQGRTPDALNHFRKATTLDPGNLQHLHRVIELLTAARRYDEARIEWQKVIASRPPSLTESYQIVFISFQASGSKREIEEFLSKLSDAEAKSMEGLSLKRDWAIRSGDLTAYVRLAQTTPRPPRMDMAVVLAAQGDLAAARAELSDTDTLRSRLGQEPANPQLWWDMGAREAVLGNRDEAQRCVRKARELRPESIDAYNRPRYDASLAFVYAWTGDSERAIAEYARLLRVPWSGLNVHEMKLHPRFAPLRSDPRFEALLKDPKNNAPLF